MTTFTYRSSSLFILWREGIAIRMVAQYCMCWLYVVISRPNPTFEYDVHYYCILYLKQSSYKTLKRGLSCKYFAVGMPSQ
jgi:hypothetical protein